MRIQNDCDKSNNCYVDRDIGVTLIVTLINGSEVYCLGGLLYPKLKSKYEKWYHVLTVASCLNHRRSDKIQVRLNVNDRDVSMLLIIYVY